MTAASPLLTFLIALLIPAGLLPTLTAVVLWKNRHSPSKVLRERRQIALVLALLGLVVAFLAANRLLAWGLEGEMLTIPFVIALLAVDVVSGKWLYDYWTGHFEERDPNVPETLIQRQDREVGDERRYRQARDKEEEQE